MMLEGASSQTKVYLAVGTVDMRKAINGLSMMVQGTLELLRHEVAREMEVAPPKSACRCRFQTASGCCGKKPWW